nr:unnamed protein product [Digitaria exilis]
MLQGLIASMYRDERATTEAEVTCLLEALLFAGPHMSSTVAAWTASRLLGHGSTHALARATSWGFQLSYLVQAEKTLREVGKTVIKSGGGGGGGVFP